MFLYDAKKLCRGYRAGECFSRSNHLLYLYRGLAKIKGDQIKIQSRFFPISYEKPTASFSLIMPNEIMPLKII